MMNKPKVSVCMITYNHEDFLEEAIESVLMQQTNFEYEIVIGEDCSTDGTREIVREYSKKHPDKIKALMHSQNLGPAQCPGKNNFVATLKACNGSYVALLEGDDYWIDPYKLQKQVDLLEKHPECSMCAHHTRVIYTQDPSLVKLIKPDMGKKFLDLSDVLQGYPFHTSSIMMRNGLVIEFPSWFYESQQGDWPLYILAAQQGSIGIIDEVMSVYRDHGGGIWTSLPKLERIHDEIKRYSLISDEFRGEHKEILYASVTKKFTHIGLLILWEELRKCTSVEEIIKIVMSVRDRILCDYNFPPYHKFQLRSKYNSAIYDALGFRMYAQSNHKSAVYYLLKAIFYDYSRLRNRGYWSIIFYYLFGKRVADLLRRII